MRAAAPPKLLTRIFGQHKGGTTATGYLNFCHRDCGDTKFRFGIRLWDLTYSCFNCGRKGSLTDILSGADLLEVSKAPRLPPPKERPPEDTALPWRRFSASQEPVGPFEAAALDYLASRGIHRLRAAGLGLGYGTDGGWLSTVIHPWTDDRGRVAGWQARRLHDPESGPKVLTASESDLPQGYTHLPPGQGGVYLLDRLLPGEPVLVVEGPYDALSGLRVLPSVSLLGSRFHTAQLHRLLSKKPQAIYLGLDPDKCVRTYDSLKRRWLPPPVVSMARWVLRNAPHLPIHYLVYPEGFEGDLGGYPDKTPRPREEVEALIRHAVLLRPGA